MADSPYLGKSFEQWEKVTAELLKKHPLNHEEIVDVVLQSWRDIFNSKLGPKEFQIGRDIYPQPQIMAFLLHELIPLELASRHAKEWRRDQFGTDKDLVYVADEQFSIEIKTSSSANGVFGNRSYAQPTQGDKKSKSGYYLAVNFDGFSEGATTAPRIRKIRFGWLDHSDWKGQAAQSGQAATPSKEAKKHKLVTLYAAVEEK
jgi:hypothetical protein